MFEHETTNQQIDDVLLRNSIKLCVSFSLFGFLENLAKIDLRSGIEIRDLDKIFHDKSHESFVSQLLMLYFNPQINNCLIAVLFEMRNPNI